MSFFGKEMAEGRVMVEHEYYILARIKGQSAKMATT